MDQIKGELIILVNVIIASILAGCIGFERERVDKPAGIRTNMLVGGAVALLVAMGKIIVIHFSSLGISEYISADPTRIIHAIIMGISFIGAGIVIQNKNEKEVKYLTTSATIFFSTGIGISVALNQYVLAISITLFILFINYILGRITRNLKIK